MSTTLDRVADAQLTDGRVVDITIADGKVFAIEPARSLGPAYLRVSEMGRALGLGRSVVVPGLVDAHVHLDKAYLLSVGERIRAGAGIEPGVSGAIAAMAAVRRHVNAESIYDAATKAVNTLISNGVVAARAHAEVDPRSGLALVEMHQRLREKYAGVLDLQVSAFPQHGIGDGVLANLTAAAARGDVQVVAGCPYVDDDPLAHLDAVFALADRYHLPLDLHLDFDDDPTGSLIAAVVERTLAHGMQGAVTIGHVTKLAAMTPTNRAIALEQLASADVALVIMPATDLYLCGLSSDTSTSGTGTSGTGTSGTGTRSVAPIGEAAAAGIRVAVTNNNIANDFAPYGNGKLLHAAWLAGILGRLNGESGRALLLDAVTSSPARILGLPEHGPEQGRVAHLAVLDTADASRAVLDAPAVQATISAGKLTYLRRVPTIDTIEANFGIRR